MFRSQKSPQAEEGRNESLNEVKTQQYEHGHNGGLMGLEDLIHITENVRI